MSDREMILTAAAVARACPREWSAFLAAYKAKTDNIKDQCISSPPETVMVAQGRAQQSAQLLRLFQHCIQDADQITEKRK